MAGGRAGLPSERPERCRAGRARRVGSAGRCRAGGAPLRTARAVLGGQCRAGEAPSPQGGPGGAGRAGFPSGRAGLPSELPGPGWAGAVPLRVAWAVLRWHSLSPALAEQSPGTLTQSSDPLSVQANSERHPPLKGSRSMRRGLPLSARLINPFRALIFSAVTLSVLPAKIFYICIINKALSTAGQGRLPGRQRVAELASGV